MYQALIDISTQKKVLEEVVKTKKAEFEEKNAVQFAQLKDLEEKEILLREKCVEDMDKAGRTTVEVDNISITRQSRVTKSVEDATILSTAIDMKIGDFKELGIDVAIDDLFANETVVKDKKAVLEVVETYNKLTGEDLDGVKIKTTNFLTIREK